MANLCQKAGSSIDEVLSLDESELEELSKSIVGNGVLEHARVVRQWRRCRMEEGLRKELEVELTQEGQGVEVPLSLTQTDQRQDVQSRVRFSQKDDVREVVNPGYPQTHDIIGESWQTYLRKQIHKEIEDSKPPPVSNVIAPSRSGVTSAFTSNDSDDDYETFVESLTIDPSLESSDEEDDYNEVKSTYNPLTPIGALASDMMKSLEDGIDNFLKPDLPKTPKKKKQKSYFEVGMDYLYGEEEPVRKKRSKKKQAAPSYGVEDGMCCYHITNSSSKEKSRSSKSKKKPTRSRSFNKWKRPRDQRQVQPEQAYKLVPSRSALQQRSKFVV